MNQLPPWTEIQGDIRLTPFYEAEMCLEKVKGYVEALNNGWSVCVCVVCLSERDGGHCRSLSPAHPWSLQQVRTGHCRGTVQRKDQFLSGGRHLESSCIVELTIFKHPHLLSSLSPQGIACNLESVGFHRLNEATKEVLGESKPYSICGSLPLVGDLQRAGFDVQVTHNERSLPHSLSLSLSLCLQVCGYGHSSVYHGDNEYCSLSAMKDALKILSCLLDKFN